MTIGYWKLSSVRPMRGLSTNILTHRFPRKLAARRTLGVSLPPATSRRVFAQQLAHAKTQRLQITLNRYRRAVNRRMNLDTLDASAPVDMEIYLEEEATEMVVDPSEEAGEPSAIAQISPEATTPVSMVLYITEGAAPEEADIDVPMDGAGSEAVSALVKVPRDADADVSMLFEKPLSAVEKVLRDADDDGSILSESPSSDLLPKMAVEDDVVSLMEKGTVAIRLYDELPSNALYSQAKLHRSCRRGYHRYEPYPPLPSLRPQQRRRRGVRTKAPKINVDSTDRPDEKTTPDDEVVSSLSEDTSDAKTEPMVQSTIALLDTIDSTGMRRLPAIAQPEEGLTSWYVPPVVSTIKENTLSDKPGPCLLPREEEDQDDWLNETSDLYWERPFTPAVRSSPTLIELEQGVEELRISPVVTTTEEYVLPEKPSPYLLPREEEGQDDWLNEASDLYWERPFTPAVPSSPTLIPLERGMERLKISATVANLKEPLQEPLQEPISCPTPVLPITPAPTPPTPSTYTGAPSQASPLLEYGFSVADSPRIAVSIQTPPKVLRREAYRDKENWSPIQFDLEAGVEVVPPPKRASSLARSVFGTLRTWVEAGWSSL